MENERQSMNKEQRGELNAEERLATFYGPPLPEQPLSDAAWIRLRSQLSTRPFAAKRLMQHLLRRRYRRAHRNTFPSFFEDAFEALVNEAHLPQKRFPSKIVRYSLQAQRRTPVVRVSSIGRRKIRLSLPLRPLEPPELDVLLATGLARLQCMHKSTYMWKQLLLLSIEPLALLVLVGLWLRGFALPFFPIAIILLLLIASGVVWSLSVLKRRIAFLADGLMVQWIGRSRACEGLHLLAGRSGAATRSGWGEPSLRERIARVCGTQVTVEHERLTLVR